MTQQPKTTSFEVAFNARLVAFIEQQIETAVTMHRHSPPHEIVAVIRDEVAEIGSPVWRERMIRYAELARQSPPAGTHPRQAGATAESLSAENALLARAVTRMEAHLRYIASVATPFANGITRLLDREREAIEAAARVWPPKGE